MARLKAARWSAVTAIDASQKGGVRGEGVVALGGRCLGVPGVPDPRGEVVRGVQAGEGVVESLVHDDRAGADVGEHVGDAPFAWVGRAGHLILAHRGHEVSEPGDGVSQGFDVCVSHLVTTRTG